MTTIISVDDHIMYREGIRAVISRSTCFPMQLIGEAGSASEFFALLSKGLIPDLVLLDIFLPDESGIEIARRLKADYPEVKIIMLSSQVSEELIAEILKIGVDGYMNKLARKEDIQNAICTVIGGSQYYGRSVSKLMHDIYLAKQHAKDTTSEKSQRTVKTAEPCHSCDSILTEREKEIISLLCEGITGKEIADKLGVSCRTIELSKSAILNKLGFSNSIDLVKYAIKEVILTL